MTTTRVHTRLKVRAAAKATSYVANEVHSLLMTITDHHQLEPDYFFRHWTNIENGLRTWISLRSLRAVVLEIYNAETNQLVRRFSTTLDYRLDWTAEDDRFESQIDRVKHELNSLGQLQEICKYRVVVDLEDDAPHVHGWFKTRFRDATHLVKRDIGIVVDTNALGAVMEFWA